ncbi:MAG: tyrosine-type recombinase/integrase [Kiritimatiellales bacterium]
MKKIMRKRGRIWYGRIRLNPTDREIEKSLKTSDKEIAQKKLNDWARQIEREHEGLAIPAKIRQAAQLPLGSHLDFYLGEKSREWTSTKNYELTEDRLKLLMRECGWKTLRDFDRLSFTQWRGRQRNRSPKTLNNFLTAVRGFSSWLYANGLIEENPFKEVRPLKMKGQTFERKALSADEISRLLETVKDPMRRAVYITALYTGLRRAEIEAVEYGDLHLDAKAPYIHARASTTKNGKDAMIALHPAVVDAILTIGKNNPSQTDRIFDVPAMKVFRADLKKAGIAYKDERGNKTDFHALRTTCCTQMLATGISPRIVQAHMRHSEIKLTTKNYTDVSQLPTTAAVNSLPDFAPHTVHPNATNAGIGSPAVSGKCEGETSISVNNGGLKVTPRPVAGHGGKWRRERDSNPRYHC